MSTEYAVKVVNISKSFKLPHERHSSIKSALINFRKNQRGYEKQHVLDNVSFEIKQGEFFGIVGRNGSGKSTLLKLLAGIYTPDAGTVEVVGKLTPFIELGVGFNPELTGRENVYLNGALLGFDRKQMNEMYEDIVSFAELERFMDQKLKNYSSGMQVRLAFSIAIRADSDVLLIDEVLAVGDAAFQAKCLDVFKNLKKQGKTIIFISHDMGTVKQFCDRAMLIKNGKIIDEGDPKLIAEKYEIENLPKEQSTRAINKAIASRDDAIITRMMLTGSSKKEEKVFYKGEQITLNLSIGDYARARNYGVAVYSWDSGYVFGTNTIYDSIKVGSSNSVTYTFTANLGMGKYYLKIGVFGKDDSEILEFYENGPVFQIKNKQSKQSWEGTTELPHSWGSN